VTPYFSFAIRRSDLCERDWLPEKPKYVQIRPCDRDELDAAFKSNDENAICNALYSAAQHEPDWHWSQTQCLKMLSHESLMVRSAALIALSEIALFRGHLELETVLPEIRRFQNDPALAPFVEDCLDNIRVAKIRYTRVT
jgi:hypothetical protein